MITARGRASLVWPSLRHNLWHQTAPARFDDIVRDGAIVAEPSIDNSTRWKTGRGPDFYPYVRHIGGVSVFDFRNVDMDDFERTCILCNWSDFVPFLASAQEAVWIEINPHHEAIEKGFVTSGELWARQDDERAHRHTLMPRIEAAVVPSVPKAAFIRVLQVDDQSPMGVRLPF